MARKQKTIHYTYKTTNLINDKYYIGMHSTNNLEDGYMGSGKRLRRSIIKYGIDNHKKEILEFFENRELLVEAEKRAITPDILTDMNCMNMMSGGTGGFISVEIAKNGRKKSDEILTEKYGVNFRKIIMVNYHNGLTDIEKKERGLKIKLGQEKVNFNRMTFSGRTHSQDTKDKISKHNSKMCGVKNSQYGTCWITKEGNNKKIKKEEFDIWLVKGWIKGRIQNHEKD